MNKKTQNIFKTLKKTSLTTEEMVSLRENVFQGAGIRYREIEAIPSRWSTFFSHRKRIEYVMALFLVALISGGSIAVASQNALPGDTLYPLKTQVTERVERFLTVKTLPEAEQFETQLVETRLIEAEQLDQKNKLTEERKEQVRAGIEKQKSKVQDVYKQVELSQKKHVPQERESTAQYTGVIPNTSQMSTTSESLSKHIPQPLTTKDKKSTNTEKKRRERVVDTTHPSTVSATTSLEETHSVEKVTNDTTSENSDDTAGVELHSILSKHKDVIEKLQFKKQNRESVKVRK